MPSQTYAQFGARPRIGFNGQLHEPDIAWQSLGNGYRTYNPTLKRFHSPDALSPFDKGGINAYAYCGNEPLNRVDPSGERAMFAWMAAGAGVLIAGGALTMAVVSDSTSQKVSSGIVAAVTIAALGFAGMRLLQNRHSPMRFRERWHATRPRPGSEPRSPRRSSVLSRDGNLGSPDLPPAYDDVMNAPPPSPPPSYSSLAGEPRNGGAAHTYASDASRGGSGWVDSVLSKISRVTGARSTTASPGTRLSPMDSPLDVVHNIRRSSTSSRSRGPESITRR